MKNVAKCDTWCELQNPVNHRVFECKLCPKPFGRGHICLGVTHRCPPTPVQAGQKLASRACPRARLAQKRVLSNECHDNQWFSYPRSSSCTPRRPNTLFYPCVCRLGSVPNTTPGQAGLPAEFKHINKRRKRNLQGFP